jgi:aminoglycoside N3'-acetyltransferase
MSLKLLMKKTIGPNNWDRLRTIYRRIVHQAPVAPTLIGSPVPLPQIRQALESLGIQKGDLLLVHSSISSLGKAIVPADAAMPYNPILYAEEIIDLLLDILGPGGTLLMPTEGNGDPAERATQKLVFDYRSTPSNRGLITELFRRRTDACRSVHPWYNITGIGPLAEELIKDHARSTPFTMDAHSPWYKLTKRGGKVLFLGATLDSNSLIHLPEYMYPAEYPRRIYQDEPLPLCYRERDGSVQSMNVKIHIPDWREGEVTRFCAYLDQHYHVYSRVRMGQIEAICHLAARQYEALCAEMRKNVCWYDVRKW